MDFRVGDHGITKVLSATMIDLQEKMLNSRQKSTEKKWGLMVPPTPSPGFADPVLYIT